MKEEVSSILSSASSLPHFPALLLSSLWISIVCLQISTATRAQNSLSGLNGETFSVRSCSAFNLFLLKQVYFHPRIRESGLRLNCRESQMSEPFEKRITEEENEDDKAVAS